jgi:hypothetical protein
MTSTPIVSDWVFKLPNLYKDCNQAAAECASIGATVLHAFNNFVDGLNQISVTCTPGMCISQ